MTLSSKSLLFRLSMPITAITLICLIAAALFVPPAIKRNTVDAASESALQTVNQIKKIRGYYTKNVISDVIAAEALRPGIDHANDPQVIPLPATFVHDVSAMLSEERTSFSLYSAFPFPNRASRELDPFMEEAWAYLSESPEGSFSRTETRDGETFLRVAVADRMVSEVCVACHNSIASSPKTDWKLGDVRGIIEVRQDIREGLQASSDLTLLLLAGVALACVALLAVAYFVARSITRPIDRICRDMEAVATGDLEVEVSDAGREDEIGKIGKTLMRMQHDLKTAHDEEAEAASQRQQGIVESLRKGLSFLSQGDFTHRIVKPFPAEHEGLREDFNLTSETLSSTVHKVVQSASSISNSAAEIGQSSDDLSSRTESQAATLEETAAALDELTASVTSAAEGARSVEATIRVARADAENNREVVQSAVSAMTEIEQSSHHISQIIGVIDDIAFQTNLLALNAGVEAARAGDAGRGFAVVASEVRALAQRSSSAAMEIKTLIGDSSKQVERGVDLVGKAGEALQSIVVRVGEISELVSGIAEGAAEQSTGLHEINTGVTQLDSVTQQNAAMVEEATAAGQLLNNDATKLAEIVAGFKITADSGSRPQATGPAKTGPAPARSPAPTAHGDDGSSWDQPAPRKAAATATTGATAAKATGTDNSPVNWEDF